MNLMKRSVELEKQIQQVASLRSQCRFLRAAIRIMLWELQFTATKQTVEVADNFNGLLRCVRNVVFARRRTHCFGELQYLATKQTVEVKTQIQGIASLRSQCRYEFTSLLPYYKTPKM